LNVRHLALAFGISLAALVGVSQVKAQTQSQVPAQRPEVNVSIGAALQARADDFGGRELDDLRKDLKDEVGHALAHSRYQPMRVDLVIEDATPNRPTFAQLSRSTGLSMRSVGVGGARVTGALVGPDGVSRPIRFQYFETDLREERGATTWSDADRSFMMLADALASGRVPDKFIGPGPEPHGGHFGYPYIGQ